MAHTFIHPAEQSSRINTYIEGVLVGAILFLLALTFFTPLAT